MASKPYIDSSGYKPPGSWIIPHVEEALRERKTAREVAWSDVPDESRFHYQMREKKGEQERQQKWCDFADPRVHRFELVRQALRAVDDVFRELAAEGKPRDLSLARSRTYLEQTEADLEKEK